MEFEIKERREYKDEASGMIYTNYKFFYGGRTYWIGQKAFEKNAKLLKIEDNKIVLKEPLKEFYELKIRKNKKGEFKTILPKIEIEAEKSIAKEPEVAYETKAKKLKKPVKKTRKQKIEDFFNLPLPKTIDKKESIRKTETSRKEPEKPEKPKEQSRQAFISSLIPHIKTADNKLKDRYFDLLSKEMERMPQMEESIMREIKELKDQLITKQNKKSEINELKVYDDLDYIVEKEEIKQRKEMEKQAEREAQEYFNKHFKNKQGSDTEKKNQDIQNKSIDFYHTPQSTVRFLSAFTKIDPIKFLTHPWDKPNEPFHYDTFMQKISYQYINHLETFLKNPRDEEAKKRKSENRKEYIQYLFRNTDIPIQTKTKVNHFVFYTNPKWSFEHIKIGWSSEEVKNWCKKNPGRYPSDFEIPIEKQEYRIQDQTRKYVFFKEIIKKFKHEIEIRIDDFNYDLIAIFKEAFKHAGLKGEFVPIFDKSLKSVECFIDVSQLKSGLKYILEPMIKYTQHPNIEFKTELDKDHYKIFIIHHNSYFRLSSMHPKLSGEQGDFGEARKRLLNHCDWSVEGKFDDGLHKIDFLKAESDKVEVTGSKFDKGIMHTLKFYL